VQSVIRLPFFLKLRAVQELAKSDLPTTVILAFVALISFRWACVLQATCPISKPRIGRHRIKSRPVCPRWSPWTISHQMVTTGLTVITIQCILPRLIGHHPIRSHKIQVPIHGKHKPRAYLTSIHTTLARLCPALVRIPIAITQLCYRLSKACPLLDHFQAACMGQYRHG
jgi:hypothetical protein